LDHARAALAVRVETLKAKGVDAKKFRADPQWRRLDARVRQINMRLRKIAEIEAVNVEIAKLKVERLARVAIEKSERRSGAAGKKAKPEAEKGKGEAKAAKKEKTPKDKGPKEKAPKEKKEKGKDKSE
jgi:hypothetical protein